MKPLKSTSKNTTPLSTCNHNCRLITSFFFLIAFALLILHVQTLYSMVVSTEPASAPAYNPPHLTTEKPSLSSIIQKPPASTSAEIPVIPLDGSNRCETATLITSLPFTDTGNTCDFTNVYFSLNCGGIFSPDCAYQYTPTSNITVDISLCGSSYDTMIHVYQNACSGVEMVCNDDYCGLQSQLFDVELTAGNTYYFVVDGAGFGCGDYIINITSEEISCSVECPPDANDEQETCGDDTNGGCNMDIPAFEPISCGQTVCGTAWDANDRRDTDWYEVVITEDSELTWTVEAEFPVVIGLAESDNPGSGDCNDITGYLEPYELGNPCQEVSITTDCLPPGRHW
ncbi:MAG: hypothetical protein ACYTEE_10815, partial [Planctomycetota bacterium]